MKIGYYIHHTSLKAGGIFTYSIGILKLLIKSDEIDKIHLIISSDQEKYFQKIISSPKIEFKVIDRKNLMIEARFAFSYILTNIAALYKHFFKKPNHLKLISKLLVLINPYCKYITSSQIDLLHVPLQYSPIYNTDVPVIITMHDIQEYHYPEYFTISQKLHRKINNITAINESDHIVVSFNHIKNDLLKYFNVKETKISVCPPPFAENWFLSKESTPLDKLISKFQIEEKFILYPAATWKHKNHSILFKALSLLNNDGIKIQLICTGNKTKYFKVLQKEIDRLGLSEQVKFLGIVPEEDLIGLYKFTSLVVIPTKYEAGSGPLYEAMRYKVPVICSNVTSLPETMGNDEFTFGPVDANEIALKIKRILRDEQLRTKNRSNSSQRLEELHRADYVGHFTNVYRRLFN
jgi:glycosyltransferase involved in cell wall biosynthesis